jgi:hypothetical protein
MQSNKQTRLLKALDDAFSGIRFDFGLFRRGPRSAAISQDQETFLRRLEEVLEPRPADYPSEPPLTFGAAAADAARPAARPAAAVTEWGPIAPVPVLEFDPACESAERNAEIAA